MTKQRFFAPLRLCVSLIHTSIMQRLEKKMKSGYGHLRGIKGDDGEAADAYLHPDMFNEPPGGSHKIFTVKQLKKDGSHDEEKHMIGWHTKEDAKDAYLEAMPESFFGGIEETTPESLQYAELTTEAIQDKYDRLSPTQQKQFMRQVAYNIVNSNYGDRISNFNLDDSPKSGSVASGSFSTPKLGGKTLIVDYVIKDSGVVLTPRNLAVIDHSESGYVAAIALGFSLAEKVGYSPLELYNYARTLKCDKGWACGGACLSKEKKNCHRALEGEHKTYVDFLKHHISRGNPLHKGHREEAEKLGIEKPKEEVKTDTNLQVSQEEEPKTEADGHDVLPKGANQDESIKAMSKITGLSEQDSAESYHAIRKFTASENYQKIREAESSGEPGKYEDTINAINNYIAYAPKYEGSIYRGLQFDDEEERDKFLKQIEKRGFKNNAVSSFSSSQKVAEGFTTKGDIKAKDSVVIILKNNKSGVSIRNISESDNEDEVLCPMGVKYKVKNKKEENGVYYVEVEQ